MGFKHGARSYAQMYNEQVKQLYERAARAGVSEADAYQALKTQTNDFQSIPNTLERYEHNQARKVSTPNLASISILPEVQPAPVPEIPAAPEVPIAPIQETEIPSRESAFIESVSRRAAGRSEALSGILPPHMPGGLLEPRAQMSASKGGLKRRTLTKLDDEEEEEDILKL